jgi:hypothetical protein
MMACAKALNMRAHRVRRLQFNLLSLFALMTVTCLLLSWWVWPQPVEVISLVHASAAPIPVSFKSNASQTRLVSYQEDLLAALHNPAILHDAMTVAGNGNLRMLRDRSDPIGWLQKRLEIKVLKNSMVSIKLTVPEYFQRDAVEVVDYITQKAVAGTSVKIGRQTREHVKRLRREHRALQHAIGETTQRLNGLREDESGDSHRAAALVLVLKSQCASLNRLQGEIAKAQSADQSLTHLQFIQSATVAAAGN